MKTSALIIILHQVYDRKFSELDADVYIFYHIFDTPHEYETKTMIRVQATK
jgi:hypothetical protein